MGRMDAPLSSDAAKRSDARAFCSTLQRGTKPYMIVASGVATGRGNEDRPPQGAVWSCKVASEAFAFISNRLAAALPRAKTTEHLAGGFCFWTAQCGTSMVGHGIPRYMSEPKRGAWANP